MTGIDTCFLVDLDVSDSPLHTGALALFNAWRASGQKLAVYYQVFPEYQHIVTDPKRFKSPLSMTQALERTWFWPEQDRIAVLYPDDDSFKTAQVWLSRYNLGRNRLIDTHMAACYASRGISTLWTAKRDDFKVFGMFELPEY